MEHDYERYICYEKFKDWTTILNHLKTKHKLTNNTKWGCVKYINEQVMCCQRFSSSDALKRHILNNKCVPKSRNREEVQHVSPADDDNAYGAVTDAFTSFLHELGAFQLPHHVTNQIILSVEKVLTAASQLNLDHMKRFNNNCDGCREIVQKVNEYCCERFHEQSTRFKRTEKMRVDGKFVPPKSITMDDGSEYQIVPITNTLEFLFESTRFKEIFYSYNDTHICLEGMYTNCCCGSNLRENNLVMSERYSVHIQLHIDEFELCDPLKSRTRKLCGIYFIIRNIPQQFVSKLRNMYLVALVESTLILKYDYNKILEPIVQDLEKLETTGISTERGNLKGILTNICFDNAGGNAVFGMVRCFSANFFCRICKSTIEECQTNTKEKNALIRTIPEYQGILAENRSAKIVLGYKDTCILNNLKNFHILKCRSQDVMHDILEGVAGFVLQQVLKCLDSNTNLSYDTICSKLNAFTYGSLDTKHKPSKISKESLKKPKLKQSATQIYCLITNLPFILSNDVIAAMDECPLSGRAAWSCIELLLQIMQVVWSTRIEEKHLQHLENVVDKFLLYKKLFKEKVKPKLHFLIHYANSIRAAGPLIYLSMMRAEGKHAEFTDYAKRTNNFKNITKTLATRHQEKLYFHRDNIYLNNIEISQRRKSALKLINSSEIPEAHCRVITEYFDNVGGIEIVEFVNFNSIRFNKDLFIVDNKCVYEIAEVLVKSSATPQIFFICNIYKSVKFHSFSNSVQIEKIDIEPVIKKLDDLSSQRSYESKTLDGEQFIMAMTLDLPYSNADLQRMPSD